MGARGETRNFVIKYIKPGMVCAEIGVFRGAFTQRIFSQKPSIVHLIDPWKFYPEAKGRLYGPRDRNSQKKMDQLYTTVKNKFEHRGGKLHRKESAKAAEDIEDNSIDFLYIDGNHDYEYVLTDLLLYIPKMKKKGIIVCDDYEYDKGPNGGPQKAVETLEKAGIITQKYVKHSQAVIQQYELKDIPDHIKKDMVV